MSYVISISESGVDYCSNRDDGGSKSIDQRDR